jgi:hypothetical protein
VRNLFDKVELYSTITLHHGQHATIVQHRDLVLFQSGGAKETMHHRALFRAINYLKILKSCGPGVYFFLISQVMLIKTATYIAAKLL